MLGIGNIKINKVLSLASRNLQHNLNSFIMCLYVRIARTLSSNQGLRLDFVDILAEFSLRECGDKFVSFFVFFWGGLFFVLFRRRDRDLFLSTVLGHRKKVSIYKPGRELSPDTDHAGTPISDFKPPDLWKS